MNVIWNLTRFCPWACRFCCMNAFYCANAAGPKSKEHQTIKRKELSFDEKIVVVRQFAETDFSVDFSGGDPLFFPEDLHVVREATKLLPKERISVSTTGIEFGMEKVKLLQNVDLAEFTLDTLPEMENPWRPSGFHASSLTALELCSCHSVATQAVTTLYPLTMTEENLTRVYEKLCEIGVTSWELLRFYPVGRAYNQPHLEPSIDDYLRVMDFVRGFQGSTRIMFQHSLRMLEENESCMAGNRTLGILPDGQVVACAWALDGRAQPAHEYISLGNVLTKHIAEIAVVAAKKDAFRLGAHGHRCAHCGLRSK